jgi:hypothetical protein
MTQDRKPFKLDVTSEWCERMAKLEEEHGGDIAAGVHQPATREELNVVSRQGWLALIDGNLEWAKALPRTLERDHVIAMLEWAKEHRNAFERPEAAPAIPAEVERMVERLDDKATQYANESYMGALRDADLLREAIVLLQRLAARLAVLEAPSPFTREQVELEIKQIERLATIWRSAPHDSEARRILETITRQQEMLRYLASRLPEGQEKS